MDDSSNQADDEEFTDPFETLVDFLDRLDEANLWYNLEHSERGIMVEVSVPGEYWEIDFQTDGTVEIERYFSRGETVRGEDDSDQITGLLGFLVDEFGDTEDGEEADDDEAPERNDRGRDIWERYRSDEVEQS